MNRIGMVAAMALSISGIAYSQQPERCPAECQCPRGAPGHRGGGWMNGPYSRIYDPKSVETIKGEIVAVERVAPRKGMSEGVHLALKTDQGTTTVHLGPAWYLDNQDLQLAKGDRVEVRGSRVTFDGKPALLAAEVKRGSETLKLRDADGMPLWRGWR